MARILVADDDRDIRDLVRWKLQSAGFEVDVTEDGAAALSALRADLPDLAILDVMMPEMDGLEVLRQVRANPQSSGLCVILLTARSREVDVAAGFECGADDYVLKPFSPRELVQRVHDLLARREIPA